MGKRARPSIGSLLLAGLLLLTGCTSLHQPAPLSEMDEPSLRADVHPVKYSTFQDALRHGEASVWFTQGAAFGSVNLRAIGGTALSSTVFDVANDAIKVICVAGTCSGGGGGGGDASAANQTTIIGHLDGVEGLLGTINTALTTTLDDFLDGLETLITATNTKLDTVIGHLDGVEGFVDGLEALITSTNTKLDTLIGHVDGIETLLTAISGFVDGIEALLTTIDADTGAIKTATETIAGVAHDAVDTGNPVKMGGKVIAHGTNPTAVAAADRTDWYFNRAGVPFVMGGHPNAQTLEAQVQDADGAQTDAALVTVGAGTKIVVTRLSMTCDASNTGPINAIVGFGTATIPARAHTGVAGILHGFDGVPAGGGMTAGNGGGILGVGADNADLRLTMEDPAGGACSVSVTYYTIES